MNLFLPEPTVYDSVIALDDRRLIKQILECKVILDVALNGKKGYANHPVVTYYNNYPTYVAYYGYTACVEYKYRFKKPHQCMSYFFAVLNNYFDEVSPTPFYAAGRKGSKDCIRTTENAHALFRDKLCKKWDIDKIAPKWTNREHPIWYTPISYLKGDENGKQV